MKQEKLSRKVLDETEDKIREMVDTLTPLEQAIIYSLLYNSGMRIQDASVRCVQAGLVN